MDAIEAPHYAQTRAALRKDESVVAMLAGLCNPLDAETAQATLEKIAHEPDENGHRTPRFEFMQAANRRYDEIGGKVTDRHIGAIAEVLIDILNRLAKSEG